MGAPHGLSSRWTLRDPTDRRRAFAVGLFALIAVSGVQCVQDLIGPAAQHHVYVFESVGPTTFSANIGDTLTAPSARLTVDGAPATVGIAVAVLQGAGVARVDSAGRVVVLGTGDAVLRLRPLSAALPVDTLHVDVTLHAVVPVLTATGPDTVYSLKDTVRLTAHPRTRGGAAIAGASSVWRLTSGAGVVTLLDSVTGSVRAESNGDAVLTGVSDTATVQRTLRVRQRAMSVVPVGAILFHWTGHTRQLAPQVKDARANLVASAALTYISRNTAVATVSGAGLVTAVGDGTTRIVTSASGPGGGSAFDSSTVVVQTARLAILSGNGQVASVGATLPLPLVVKLVDAGGGAVADSLARVVFRVTAGSGRFAGADSAVVLTDTAGRASASLTLGTAVAPTSVQVTGTGLAGTPLTFTATPAPATRLKFAVQPSAVPAGGSITPVVKVEVRDTFNTLVPSVPESVTVALAPGTGTAGAALLGTTKVATVAGVATFTSLTVDKAGTGFRLIVSAAGLTPDTSAAFNVTAGAPDHMAFLAPPLGARAGVPVYPAVQVKVVDASGNAIPTFTGDVTLSIGRVPATGSDRYFGTATVSAVAGVASFSDFGIQTAATGYKLRAASSGLVAILSDLFDVSGAPDTLRLVSGNGQGGIVNAVLADSLVVRVVDASGIGVAGDTVVFRVTAGGGKIGGADSALVLTVGGRAAAALRLGATTGTDTVVVRSKALAGRTVTFTATAVEAGNRLQFVTQPTSFALGASITPAVQVRVRNGFGQTVTGATAAVTLSVLSGTGRAGATVTGTVSAPAVGGVATFPAQAVSRSGTGYRLVATATDIASDTSATFDVAQVPVTVEKGWGDNQNGDVGARLTDDFVLRVLDAAGDPIAGDTVVFRIASGVGTLYAGTDSMVSVTDAAGRALAGLTLGPSAGTVTVSAHSRRLAGQSVTYAASATAAGRRLEFITQPTSIVAGSTFSSPIQVRVFDSATGVTDTSATTIIHLWNSYGVSLIGAIEPDGTRFAQAVHGVATFDGLGVAGPVGTGFRLQVSADRLGSDVTVPFDVTAGAPARLAFNRWPARLAAGEMFIAQVFVEDAHGNIVPSATNPVTVALTAGSGTAGAHVRGGDPTTAAFGGVMTSGGMNIDSAGTGYSLTATSPGLTGVVSPIFEVTPAPASRLVLTSQPSGAVAGAPWSAPVEVLVEDSLGNLVLSSNVVVSLGLGSNPGGGRLLGGASLAAAGGVASFSDLRLRFAGTGYTLVASAPFLASATSAPFDVAPAPASRLVFAVQPSNVAPGVAISPSVQVAVWDSIGNVVTSSSAPVSLVVTPGTGGGGTLNVVTNAVNGVAVFYPLSIATAGYNYTLTATSGTLTPAVSGQFSVVTTASARLVFKSMPAQVTAGAPAVMTVAVEDGSGTRASTFTGNVTLTITSGTGAPNAHLRGTTTVAAVAGLATFSGLSVDSAFSDYTFTATASGVASGTSAVTPVLPAPAIRMAWRVEPTSRTAGNVFSPAMQVVFLDSLGNVSGFSSPAPATVSITPGTGAPGATLSGTTTAMVGAGGVAVFGDLSIDKAGTGYSLTVSAPVQQGSLIGNAFSIVAGPVARVVVTPDGVSLIVFGTQRFTAQALDRFDNPISAHVEWNSWGYGVASIDSTGLVTARNAGQSVIGAIAGGPAGSAVVTVAAPDAAPVNLWVRVPSGTAADLFAIGGGSPSEAFASGANGVVLRLGQNGAWTPVESGTTETLTGLWALAPSNVVVAGGRALRGTWDMGADWVDWPVGSVGALANVWGASWTDLFAVGQGGTIVRFRNGTAEPMTSGVAGWLWGVYGTSASNVVAVGAGGAAVRFDGTTWAPMSITGTPNLLAVWGTGPNSMYAGGEGVWHWNGSAWSLMPGSGAASGIWGAADNDIYTVTGTGDIQRYDGSAWHAMTSGTTANLHAVWGTGAGSVYAVGDGGTILRGVRGAQIAVSQIGVPLVVGATARLTAEARASGNVPVEGATFAWSSQNPAVATVDSTGLVTAVGPGSTTITVSAPGGVNAGVAVTVRQEAVRIDLPTGYVGGVGGTWTPPAVARDANNQVIAGQGYTWASLNPAIATVDPTTGLVTFVGMGQAVIVARAGAATGYTSVHVASPAEPVNLWAPMANPAGGTLTSLWGTSRTSIYAGGIGVSGLILHYDGAGWSQMASPATGTVLSMGGFADSLIWAGENNHPMLRFNGHSWSSEPDPGFVVEAIGGYHPRDLYMVGGAGSVRHYDGSSWSPVTSGTSQTLLGVYQVTGPLYVVGQAGTILRDWVPQAPGLTTANLEGIWGQPNRLYAVGTGGTILRTWDEGPWSAMISGTAANLSSVTGTLSDRDVYAVGDGGTILRFDGAAWTAMASGTTANLSAAWTAPDGDVYVVGDIGTILHGYRGATVAVTPTTATLTALGATQQLTATVRDASNQPVAGVTGLSWSSATPSVATVGATTGVVTAAANGTAVITATAPGGASGSTTVTVSQRVTAIALSSVGDWLNVGGSHSTLVGTPQDSLGAAVAGAPVTWSSLNPNVATVVPSTGEVTAVGPGQTTIIATSGSATNYDVVTVTQDGAAPNLFTRATGIPNQSMTGVWAASPTDAFAVGSGGTILHWNGSTWVQQVSGTTNPLNGVWGTSPTDVFAVGGSKALHWNGTSWSAQPGITNQTLQAVWGASPANVWAVGASGVIMHWDGSSWTSQASGTSAKLNAVWGRSASDVYAAGDGGVMLRYDGASWSAGASPTAYTIYGLWGFNSSAIYAVAYNAQRLRWNGSSWVVEAAPPSLFGVGGTSATNVVGVGDGGGIVRWDGSTWTTIPSGTTAQLNSVRSTSPTSLFVTGNGGTILRGYVGATLTVGPSDPTLFALGIGVQLSATARDASGNVLGGVSVTWTSSDTTVVRVSATGQVTGVAPGSATVTASAGAIVASTTVGVAPSAQQLTRLSSGYAHACGLTAGGAAYCWGWNQYGQLGDGTTTDRASPVPVAGGLTFATIAAFGAGNGWSTCGLTVGGTAYCWGSNASGQLGDGTNTDRSSPVAVAGGLSFQAISVGPWHACGLTVSGAAYCWGDNAFGQLGDGTNTNRRTAVAVGGGLTFQGISAGYWHTCGVTAAGAGYCWGDDSYGELGDGTNTNSGTPVAVTGGLTFQALSAGQAYNCGIVGSGAAYCWGGDDSGQLGSGNAATNRPVAVPDGLTYQSITTGYEHTCGITTGGTAHCWGTNYFGELGNGTRGGSQNPPVAVTGGLTFQSITGGYFFTCAVTAGGATYCWGNNRYAQLGNGAGGTATGPVPVAGDLTFQAISAGVSGHACGLTTAGAAYCWGQGPYGELGTTVVVDGPAPVTGGLTFQAINAFNLTTCGLATGGAAYCWGYGYNLGTGGTVSSTSPVAVAGGRTFKALGSGIAAHICGVASNSAAYCWGDNESGDLGDGGVSDGLSPAAVQGGLDFLTITTGWDFSCGLTTAGKAYCWGANNNGKLGDGTGTWSTTPVAVAGNLTFASISSGFTHTCALTEAGIAYCWGGGSLGQSGGGAFSDSATPIAVSGGLTFQQLSSGNNTTCGVTTTGAAYCWGDNSRGQLGDGSQTNHGVPVAVAGAMMFQRISVGDHSTCGLTTGGAAYCWGDNSSLQRGDGTGWRTSPTPVAGGITFGAPIARLAAFSSPAPRGR